MARVITLCTDFGTIDPYVGIMKGCILGIAPQVRLVDLTHQLPPQDRTAAALALDASVDYFPWGTIHVVVVDPGVGTSRRALAVQFDRGVLIGPDNGVFELVVERYPPARIISIEASAYRLEPVSATFHGRDVFAPAAAHLAAGVPLDELGPPVSDPVRLEMPQPQWRDSTTVVLTVLAVDRFGNLILNLREDALPRDRFEALEPGEGRPSISHLGTTYADVASGEALAYIGSSGRLEVAVREGSASQVTGLVCGDQVVLRLNR